MLYELEKGWLWKCKKQLDVLHPTILTVPKTFALLEIYFFLNITNLLKPSSNSEFNDVYIN